MNIENTSKQAFGPGAAIGTAAIQGASGFGAQLLANRANRKLAEYQYSKELEAWNRQNEYNSPTNQMARFKEAGLNPALIYGKGTAGNATTLPKYQAPTISHKNPIPDTLGTLSQYYGMQNLQEQNNVLKQQGRLAEEKALTESYRRTQMDIASGFMNWKWKQQAPAQLSMQKIMHSKKAAAMNQQWTYRSRQMDQMQAMTQLAKYNAKIAEQNMLLKIKDNKYYLWKNMGAGLVKGAGNMFKVVRGRLKGGKPPKLNSPKIPKGLGRNNSDILPNYNFYN